jgi:hypothetical protein
VNFFYIAALSNLFRATYAFKAFFILFAAANSTSGVIQLLQYGKVVSLSSIVREG